MQKCAMVSEEAVPVNALIKMALWVTRPEREYLLM